MKTKIASLITCTLLSIAASRAAAGGITLTDFKLIGDLGGEVAAFTLTANAKVEDAKGDSLALLSGPVALTSLDARQKWQMEAGQNGFMAKFDRGGTFPIEVHFNAAVTQSNGWKAVDFRVATSALQPVVLSGTFPVTGHGPGESVRYPDTWSSPSSRLACASRDRTCSHGAEVGLRSKTTTVRPRRASA